jgi:ADP-ribose pyrophosphatase YjhB (NUDIX family)
MENVIVTSNLIEKDDKFLLVQEGHKYAYGLWNFPAGRIEESITLAQNAEKETKEESGYDVKATGFVGIYHQMAKDRNVIIICFNSVVTGGKIRDQPDEEILQAKWFTFDEIKNMKKQLRGKYIIDSISDFKKRGSLSLDAVKSSC